MTARPNHPGTSSNPHETPEMREAEELLREKAPSRERCEELAKTLKNERRFGLARRLYERLRGMVEDEKSIVEFRQQHALCTYKDPDLPADDRLTDALEILKDGEDLTTTQDAETLGLAGAIFKRRWEVDAQVENLERSLGFYLRGHAQGPEHDHGYTGINAAFVLDIMASLAMKEAAEAGIESTTAAKRRQDAREIREELIEALPPMLKQPDSSWVAQKWWFHVTLAEAYFGLERYDEAIQCIETGKALPDVPKWELQSFALQLASLSRLHAPEEQTPEEFANSEPGRVLRVLLGENDRAVRDTYLGKVGLGLSGGGFRASLYHIGVLAKLAELDVLKYVEVLSCVSGGSILGAHYYLEVKELLESKFDKDVDREDYVDLVMRLENDFLTGVQKNIRTRVASSLANIFQMIFSPSYSRTTRVGELYERWIFKKVKRRPRPEFEDGKGHSPRAANKGDDDLWLSKLYVIPAGEREFKPSADNWSRAAKVPDLILNATTLNTGHNWQFTASWMGEPPGSMNKEVDGNYRLRRMYYDEAPEDHRNLRLGHAVAASACVPGLFEPLALGGLYRNRTVRLVDGGVHDNQGIVGLLEHDCSVILVSDASGQMGTVDEPASGLISVPLRSNSILMSRVRTEQYGGLVARQRSGLLRGLMYVHLMKDLDGGSIDWIGCKDEKDESTSADTGSANGDSVPEELTSYGILKRAQRLIAGIRTDLDSFHDAEAFALMTSGYRMVEQAFEREESLKRFPTSDAPPADWRFLAVEPQLQDPKKFEGFEPFLRVAAKPAFKVWELVRWLKIFKTIVVVALLAGFGWLVFQYWSTPLVRVKTVAFAAVTVLIGGAVGKWIVRIANIGSAVQKAMIGIGLALGGFVAALVHLHGFDKMYLRAGRRAVPDPLPKGRRSSPTAGTPASE